MHIKLGDTLDFNVQGAPIQTIVGGTREVEWNRVQTNFLVVFPSGVLEQAPQFHVLMTRVPNNQASATLQRALVSDFPNVSAIDLGLILKTVDDILGQISFVIQFMALFSILTGLLVLASSVVISKYQRLRESVLLRTLGPVALRFCVSLHWNTGYWVSWLLFRAFYFRWLAPGRWLGSFSKCPISPTFCHCSSSLFR